MIWVLVDMDVSEELLRTLKIRWEEKVKIQPLDYLNTPFKFLNYIKVGHVVNSCNSPP